jgi:hypothetical protein
MFVRAVNMIRSLLLGCYARLYRAGLDLRSDTGDVPGWVMITLMTAGLVVLLTGLASVAFGNIFDKAVRSVCPSC